MTNKLVRYALGSLGTLAAVTAIVMTVGSTGGDIVRSPTEQAKDVRIARANGEDVGGAFRQNDVGGVRETAGAVAEKRNETVLSVFGKVVETAAAFIWKIVRWPLLALVLISIPILASRYYHRQRRTMVRYLITPGLVDEATPEQVMRLWDTLMRMGDMRWWERPLKGQGAPMVPELISRGTKSAAGQNSSGDGSPEQFLVIAIPDDERSFRAIEGAILARYPNTRFDKLVGDPAEVYDWASYVIRLKKARLFPLPLALPAKRNVFSAEEAESPTTDAVLSVMSRQDQPCLVQIVPSPTPMIFQRMAREYEPPRDEAQRMLDETGSKEAQGAAWGTAHRLLAFTEIRIAAPDRDTAQSVASLIEAQMEGGENRLLERHMKLRRGLYVRRMQRALGNPIPSWIKGVLSTLEMSNLWQLPQPGTDTTTIDRTAVLRLRPPQGIYRPKDESRAIARDSEGGLVGIHDDMYYANLKLVGAPGTGKTSVLLRITGTRAHEPETAIFQIDNKEGLAQKSLGLIPPSKKVYYMDFDDPTCGYNFLRAPGYLRKYVRSTAITSFREAFRNDDGSVQQYASSERTFGFAIDATLTHRNPTLWHLKNWLDPSPVAVKWREENLYLLQQDPTLSAAFHYYAEYLPNLEQKSSAEFNKQLTAPLNKVERLIGDEGARNVFHHPNQIDLDQILREGGALIIKANIPQNPDRELLVRVIVENLMRTIMRQSQLPENERRKAAVIIDEAKFALTPSFIEGLDTGRSAGFQAVIGSQYEGQNDPRLQAAIDSQIPSAIYFRLNLTDARKVAGESNSSFSDNLSNRLDDRQRALLDVNNLTALDNFWGIAKFMIPGRRTSGRISRLFSINTIPMGTLLKRAWAEHHLLDMKERGFGKVRSMDQPRDTKFHVDMPVADAPAALPALPAVEGVHVDSREPVLHPTSEGGAPANTAESSERRERVASAVSNGSAVAAPAAAVGVAGGAVPPGSVVVPPPPDWDSLPANGGGGDAQPSLSEHTKAEPQPEVSEAVANGPSPDEIVEHQPGPTREEVSNNDRAAVGQLGTKTSRPLSPMLDELVPLDTAKSLTEIKVVSEPRAPDSLDRKELLILKTLAEFGVLLGTQIDRDVLGNNQDVASKSKGVRVGRAMKRLLEADYVRTFQFTTKSGKMGTSFVLTPTGYTALKNLTNGKRYGGKYNMLQLNTPAHAIHELHRNAYLFAMQSLAPKHVKDWRGSRAGRIDVPEVAERFNRTRKVTITDLGSRRPHDLKAESFAELKPDVSMEMSLRSSRTGESFRTDLLVEIERRNNQATLRKKLEAYDAMLCGWWRLHSRYGSDGGFGKPPILWIVVEDVKRAEAVIAVADKVMTGFVFTEKVHHPTEEEEQRGERAKRQKLFLGRVYTKVAVEQDLHGGTLRAMALQKEPPEERAKRARGRIEKQNALRPAPEPFELISPRHLEWPAE